MTTQESLLMIFVVAACTLSTRLIPFVLFGGRCQVPKAVSYLGGILPPAIMATLVVYCLKDVNLSAGAHGFPEFFSAALVAGLHAWKRNVLLSILSGTICYMFLIQVVFPNAR